MIDQSHFSDVLCGTLHCQGGMEKPILPMGTSGVGLINTQVIMMMMMMIDIERPPEPN